MKALLEKKKWSQRILAAVTQIDRAVINKIIQNRRSIDPDTALILAEVFDGCCSAEDFLQVQSRYDLTEAQKTYKTNTNRSRLIEFFKKAPLLDMQRRNWITIGNDFNVAQLEKELLDFYGTDSVDGIGKIRFAPKRTAPDSDVTPMQSAWVNRAKQMAKAMSVAVYDSQKLRASLDNLRQLMMRPEDIGKVPAILAACGVRYAVVEGLKSSKIDGACFWIDGSPVIVMSLRFDRIDNFWYVLRHEIEHVLREHGKDDLMLDVDLSISSSTLQEEREADRAYHDFIDPNNKITAYIQETRYFSERSLAEKSGQMRLHPGIIAGQIQYRTGNYSRFRNHLVKVREYILQTAIFDGWGTVWSPDNQFA